MLELSDLHLTVWITSVLAICGFTDYFFNFQVGRVIIRLVCRWFQPTFLTFVALQNPQIHAPWRKGKRLPFKLIVGYREYNVLPATQTDTGLTADLVCSRDPKRKSGTIAVIADPQAVDANGTRYRIRIFNPHAGTTAMPVVYDVEFVPCDSLNLHDLHPEPSTRQVNRVA